MNIKIHEIFNSIQGEGKNLGKPMTFIRFSGCTMGCKFCDTKQANKGRNMSLSTIMKKVKSYKCGRVCITGGEPTEQGMQLRALLCKLRENRYDVYLETNGSNNIPDIGDVYTTCSPKKKNRKWQVDDSAYDLATEWKFVVNSERELKSILKEFQEIPHELMTIMPKGDNRTKLIKSSQKVWMLCVKYGLRFTPREHIMVFDKKKSI